ncbi:hypothetical protein [Nonomuraea sp. NPDC050786]|uniref:hypothetical protein n=1 Tax=Nonomuraea sp. NPDC050786 TaxID=3154840 RepID=UPI0033FC9AB7
MIAKIALATVVVAALPMAAKGCEADAQASKTVSGSCRAGLTGSQAANARAVLQVADDMGLPERAKVIAIATTLQESDLDENEVGDGGQAVGVFQQHPHWGRNRTDPAASARRFYARLVKVPRWKTRPLTEAAQAVQGSAFPNAYAKHEARATRIVSKLTACMGGDR